MSAFILEILDSLDAEIFSGDALYTNIKDIKEYIERWNKAINAHESLEGQEEKPSE